MTDSFRTTQWTRVLAARGHTPDAQQALSDLCAAYYSPVLNFLRHSGHDEDAARELAHEFFARVLERHGLDGADQQRGRFRTYLLGAVKHFLANYHAAAMREKRGGGAAHEPLHPVKAGDTETELELPDRANPSPDLIFDREWAVNLLDRSLQVLEQELKEAGDPAHFDILKPWLTGARPDISQAEAASKLGISEGAVRVSIHRLRRRFRDLVKAEIARTVGPGGEVEEELNHLIKVLSHRTD